MARSARKTEWESLRRLAGRLIVSCQASHGEPLCAPEHIKALALSALNGGAAGLRLEGPENIRTVRAACDVPIIGLTKSPLVRDEERLNRIYITATMDEAKAIAEAGADIVAIDATDRQRPDSLSTADFISRIHDELDRPVWADVATLDQGLSAAAYGADVISTTLSGYTAETYVKPDENGPDFKLLAELCRQTSAPVVLEGRVWHPDEVKQAFSLGAFAVVVGSAITRPQLVTGRFVKACPPEGL